MKLSRWAFICLVPLFASYSANAKTDLLKLCQEAAPSLQCENLLNSELERLEQICSDPSLDLVPADAFGIGGKEVTDKYGNTSFTFDPKKQGSANGRTHCPVPKAYAYPRTENDVVVAVHQALSQGWKIKATGAAHTDNELICTDGLALSNRFMDRVLDLEMFEGVETVRVQPGVTIRELGEWLHARHKSLGNAIVGYEAVTIGGVIGTGAHGSSVKETAILSDTLQSVRIALSNGTVEEFSRETTGRTNPELWKGLSLNLGLMGIVTEVRVRVQEDFQINMVTQKHPDADLFEKGVLPYIQDCDTASLMWFPERGVKKGRVIQNCGKKIPKPDSQSWEQFGNETDKGARYVLHAPSIFSLFYTKYIDDLHRGVCQPDILAGFEKFRRSQVVENPPYVFDRKYPIPGFPSMAPNPEGIRGWSFEMQNSVGSPQANRYRQTDWEVAIPVKKSAQVFRFLRRFLNGKDPSLNRSLPLPTIGVFLRFSKASETLISHAAVGGDIKSGDTVMFVEMSEFLPEFIIHSESDQEMVDAIMKEYERPFEAFVVQLMKRFGGRVHWAKNRTKFFAQARNQPDRAMQLQQFERVVHQLDPVHLFSNSLSSELFGQNSMN